jgi:uncharacterized protein YbjT (DUF2867 family)
MTRFDLNKYATVAERLAMLEAAYPDYRLETFDYSTAEDRAKGVWRVRATLYLSREDQLEGLAKATGHAFEVDSANGQGPNATSALENCETSAVGRCMALASNKWTGNKDDAARSLASREEMEKVQRGAPAPATVEAPASFFDDVAKAKTVDELEGLWNVAKAAGYAEFVRKVVSERKAMITGGKK